MVGRLLSLTRRYQVRVGIVQAGHFGAPQQRRRFILIAADGQSTLPQLPHPTHAFNTITLRSSAFPDAQPDWPVDVDEDMRSLPRCVLHPGMTVEDAIGDLHPFDWLVALNYLRCMLCAYNCVGNQAERFEMVFLNFNAFFKGDVVQTLMQHTPRLCLVQHFSVELAKLTRTSRLHSLLSSTLRPASSSM
jgi:hypothetical protein